MADSRPQPSGPTVIAVLGLKSSGKTTAAAAVIAGLSARGYRVAAMKSSHLARLDVDPHGRDSRQLYDAGADCVVAQGREEILVVRRQERPAPLPELVALMPPHLDFIIMEGGPARYADAVFLCLRALSELEETLKVRRVPVERVRAVTGTLAAARVAETVEEPPAAAPEAARAQSPSAPAAGRVGVGGAAAVPLLDAADPEGREGLIELALIARAGRRSR